MRSPCLKDQDGEERALKDFVKKGKVALVFYGSAEWCPFCKKHLVQLQADHRKIEDAGLTGLNEVAVFTYDDTGRLSSECSQPLSTFL